MKLLRALIWSTPKQNKEKKKEASDSIKSSFSFDWETVCEKARLLFGGKAAPGSRQARALGILALFLILVCVLLSVVIMLGTVSKVRSTFGYALGFMAATAVAIFLPAILFYTPVTKKEVKKSDKDGDSND